jgi:hypothetical protein
VAVLRLGFLLTAECCPSAAVGSAGDQKEEPLNQSVIRYVATYVNKDGVRTLMSAAQGRNTFATSAEAEDWINAVTTNNSADTLHQIWGNNPQFEARPCPCYPVHHDPQTIWFDGDRT